LILYGFNLTLAPDCEPDENRLGDIEIDSPADVADAFLCLNPQMEGVSVWFSPMRGGTWRACIENTEYLEDWLVDRMTHKDWEKLHQERVEELEEEAGDAP